MENLNAGSAAAAASAFEEENLAQGALDAARLEDDVRAACDLVPPLWSLRSFVAVNPYLGLTDLPFATASEEVEQIFHARWAMPLDFYAEQYRSGRIEDDDLVAAAEAVLEASPEVPFARRSPEATARELAARTTARVAEAPRSAPRMLTFAEAYDRAEGTSLAKLIVGEIGRWLAGRFDGGQAAWPQPGRDEPLFRAWRETARIDRSLELQGLTGFRDFVGLLPRKPVDAIAFALDRLAVPTECRQRYLARQLASVLGWAGHLQRGARDAAALGLHDSSLEALLAVRVVHDAALAAMPRGRDLVGKWSRALRDEALAERPGPASADERTALLIWQGAYELGYRRTLLDRLGHVSPRRTARELVRPRLQAVFCIDVRSEVIRRRLEALDARIQTLGFAGFFGMPIDLERSEEDTGSARCPVLIQPSHRVQEVEVLGAGASGRLRLARERHRVFTKLRKLAVGTFPLVETIGQGFGLRLLSDSLGWTHPGPGGALFDGPDRSTLAPSIRTAGDGGAEGFGIPLGDRVDLAEGALRGMGLTSQLAPTVLLCGHGSSTSNNPYGSALDCGACGGHAGDANARVACEILNDPAVRSGLRERGIDIPADTVFVAGLHDTTRDRVALFDTESVSAEHLIPLEDWLDRAARSTADERAGRLGEANGSALGRRATDWSEVRPEWGLAGNAAFIAAPRTWTRELDLGGRCFLHDYDESQDEDGSILETILTAPLVVASWINLQYYASTVDNEVFGSGDKTIHNVTGRHGVVLGNGGDLQTGLPWQSVHDGSRFVHEPMRLTAVVRASEERIEQVLARHEDLRNLVENQWIHLIRWDPETATFEQRRPQPSGPGWHPAVPREPGADQRDGRTAA